MQHPTTCMLAYPQTGRDRPDGKMMICILPRVKTVPMFYNVQKSATYLRLHHPSPFQWL